jgi:cytoskeletal protein CcmA (bactofilin family)
MLESFRKREIPKPNGSVSSPYSQLQEALSPARAAELHKAAESLKTDAQQTAPAEAPPEPVLPVVAAATSDESVSRLIVGPDIKLKGVEITDCDTLVVEGRVEASMDSRVIQIAENGVFIGTVGIDIAEIRGRFEGELDARKQLVIRSTGRVSGKIRYGKIMIEEGGELSGDVAALGKGSPSKNEPSMPIAKAIGQR